MCTISDNRNRNSSSSSRVAEQRFATTASTTRNTTVATTKAVTAGVASTPATTTTKRYGTSSACSRVDGGGGGGRVRGGQASRHQVPTVSALRWLLLAVAGFACLSLPVVVIADSDGIVGSSRGGRDDSSIEEGHVSPGAYATHGATGGATRSLWWPAAVSVSTQALLRHIGLPHGQTSLSPLADSSGHMRGSSPFGSGSSSSAAGVNANSRLQQHHLQQHQQQQKQQKSKRGSRRVGEQAEHSNPQIPTTGVRAPRGAHEYDVPQIECPNAEDGMERFACPTPDPLGRYRCIDDHVLCDGFLDCPDGSDEDRHSCMFYKTTKAHLDVLADALLRWARGRYN